MCITDRPGHSLYTYYVRTRAVRITIAFMHREKQRAERGVTLSHARSPDQQVQIIITIRRYPRWLSVRRSARTHACIRTQWFLAVSVLSAKRNFRRIFFPPRIYARELRPRYKRLNLTARFCRRINGRDRAELASRSHSAPCLVFAIFARLCLPLLLATWDMKWNENILHVKYAHCYRLQRVTCIFYTLFIWTDNFTSALEIIEFFSPALCKWDKWKDIWAFIFFLYCRGSNNNSNLP